MYLRINDIPVQNGDFGDNFIKPEPGNSYSACLHRQKSTSNNYEMVKRGTIGIRTGSKAQECIENLMFGFGRIDFLETDGKLLACFRDSKVLISTYLVINDKTFNDLLSSDLFG